MNSPFQASKFFTGIFVLSFASITVNLILPQETLASEEWESGLPKELDVRYRTLRDEFYLHTDTQIEHAIDLGVLESETGLKIQQNTILRNLLISINRDHLNLDQRFWLGNWVGEVLTAMYGPIGLNIGSQATNHQKVEHAHQIFDEIYRQIHPLLPSLEKNQHIHPEIRTALARMLALQIQVAALDRNQYHGRSGYWMSFGLALTSVGAGLAAFQYGGEAAKDFGIGIGILDVVVIANLRNLSDRWKLYTLNRVDRKIRELEIKFERLANYVAIVDPMADCIELLVHTSIKTKKRKPLDV